MQRRDALKLLFAGTFLPALTPEAFALLRNAHPGEGYALRTLNPHQNATVVVMTDLILPQTNTPGAKAAKVNEFIDLILSDWANEEERAKFLDGLGNVDKQSNELFGKDFADATPAQQSVLLRSMDDAAIVERGTAPRSVNPVLVHDTQLQGSFWPVFKGITLHGYYTSEIGYTQELKLQIIPGQYHGCAPIPEASKA